MSRVDHYKKLRKRIEAYIGRYPLPSRINNNKNFITLRLMQEDETKKVQYKRLRDTIIISNGGFGMKYAIAYCKKINDESIIEDIFQQAQMGIIEAVDRFDPHRGVNFTTFAWHYVRKCIIDFIKCNKIVAAPRDMARNIKNVSDVQDKLYTETEGEEVTAIEIKERLFKDKEIDLKEDMIRDIVHLIELNSAATKTAFITDIPEDLAYREDHELYTRMTASLHKDLIKLDSDLLDLVKMRFGIDYDRPYSLPEIAIVKGLTAEEIEGYKEKTRVFLNSCQENI